MSRAKETGKARCVVYSAQASGPPQHDISLEAAMFQAVREGEFLLYYQPIVDTRTRQIQGFETLMRWKHPTLGMVPPSRFIPIAETNGLINLLGAWALKAACVQLKHFEEAARRELYISVNISPRQFRNDKFLDVLDDAIAFSGIRGDQLVLEITEGTLMIDPAHAETILTRMAERKARIAIDDFGTGYSSLAYLKRFPISVLKVDRAFVKDLPASEKDGAICNAVLDLARHLDLSVVAEGVETEPQLDFLARHGCQYIQGYLTGKPMTAHVAMAALSATSCATIQATTEYSISMWAIDGLGEEAESSSISFRPSARWPMASVPSTSIALVTVLTRWPNAEYMPLLARRSTFWVSTGSVSTVCAMLNSCSSSPRMAPRMAPMARAKPGMSPCWRTRSHSRARVASARGAASAGGSLVIGLPPFDRLAGRRRTGLP
jgi:EAL domain-containing protein (putative c-di-GMP-specific phosphodiesterase class I)